MILLPFSPEFKIELLIIAITEENKKYAATYHFTDKQLSGNIHKVQNGTHSMFK